MTRVWWREWRGDLLNRRLEDTRWMESPPNSVKLQELRAHDIGSSSSTIKQNTILRRQFYMSCCWSYWLFLIDWNQNSDENRSVYYSIIGLHQKRSGDTIRSKLTVAFFTLSHSFDQIVCRAKDQWVLASGSWQKSSLLSIPESPEWSLSSPSSSPPLLLICLHFSSSSSSFFFSAALRGSSPQACFGFSGGEQYEMIAVVTWKRNFPTSCKNAQFLPSPIL